MAVRNRNITLLASAARTASVNSDDQKNLRHKGVRVHVDATAATATPGVIVKVQGKNKLTGDYYDILASASITAIGDTDLLVYPGIADVANLKASQPLPAYWRVVATHADSDSITYSVTAELLA